jgi:hypothetical protein
MQRLEQVQVRVLRRIVGLNSHIPDDVLRMELGCRSYASWMDQRKLEYAFRLGRIDVGLMTGCPATYKKLPGQQRVASVTNACMPAWCQPLRPKHKLMWVQR